MEEGYFKTIATGVVIYYYDFVNKEGKSIKTGKAIFDVLTYLPVEVTSQLITPDMVGKKIQCVLGYNGKNWQILEIK